MELENKEICAKCGGKCCKKSGCDYFVSDFDEINKNKLLEILATGNVSITSALKIKMLTNGQKYIVPFLYLRARNKGRDVIDLFSLKFNPQKGYHGNRSRLVLAQRNTNLRTALAFVLRKCRGCGCSLTQSFL